MDGVVFSCNSFFKYFVYNPNSAYLNKDDPHLNLTENQKKIIKIATTIFNCLSLTLVPRLCRYMWQKDVKTLLTPFLKSSIQNTPFPTISEEQRKEAERVACHQIVNHLFLGNSEAFVNTTHFTFTPPDKYGRPMQVTTANHLAINHVITLCPRRDMQGDFCEFFDEVRTTETIATSFSDHGVSWLNVGRCVADNPKCWLPIVHDCTEPQSEDALLELDVEGRTQTQEQRAVFWERKSQKINQKPVAEWFRPVFETIDKAVFGSEHVLIHCQAGISRSASVLTAYLISRFDLTPDQAINFLRSKRPCVSPKFKEQLSTYHGRLQQGS